MDFISVVHIPFPHCSVGPLCFSPSERSCVGRKSFYLTVERLFACTWHFSRCSAPNWRPLCSLLPSHNFLLVPRSTRYDPIIRFSPWFCGVEHVLVRPGRLALRTLFLFLVLPRTKSRVDAPPAPLFQWRPCSRIVFLFPKH